MNMGKYRHDCLSYSMVYVSSIPVRYSRPQLYVLLGALHLDHWRARLLDGLPGKQGVPLLNLLDRIDNVLSGLDLAKHARIIVSLI
jgi:hypothetical protein